ncbi:hypothetical protein QBZ16_000179 [Prototheca wickerhamii]|uniref:RING-type domain-containing protein n=1 Tax=Prototheca wickerhamii TaxID=3111 RepID=A0AAD9MP48_PROWI|nr:hypothetical protein QBZ16_000179 [Prototheca wickerhamii]
MEFANPGADTMRDMILNALMETGLALPDGILMSEGALSAPSPRLKVRSLASASPDVGEASAAPGEVCTVCHDAFKPGDEVIELPCNHCFHEDCLLPWLQSHNTCPVCRLELPAEEASQASRGDQGQGASQSAAGGQRAGRPAQVYYAASGPGFSGGNEEGGVERSFGSTLAQLVSSVASQWLQAQNLEAGREAGVGLPLGALPGVGAIRARDLTRALPERERDAGEEIAGQWGWIGGA